MNGIKFKVFYNCIYILFFNANYNYRMFEEYMTEQIPRISSTEMEKAKDEHFAEWCKDYVSTYIC